MQDLISELNQYSERHSSISDPLLLEIERATHLKTLTPRMLSGPLQGALLILLSKIIGPKRVLEIGTFTGYSAICFCHGLQADGHIDTIEYDPEHASIADDFFNKSTYRTQINLHVGDAKLIVPTLPDGYDLVYIDADKEAYGTYYDMVLPKCNPGAIIMADNVLWSGKVLDDIKDKKTQCLADFNRKILNDTRVENLILPLRDGINVIRKK
ncbi:MAG: O-methyltransferase [Saprospiraceae bacterium]